MSGPSLVKYGGGTVMPWGVSLQQGQGKKRINEASAQPVGKVMVIYRLHIAGIRCVQSCWENLFL